MIDSVFARLIWKEYRVQRSFWISVAVVALVGQLLAWRLLPSQAYRPDWLFGMALTFPALFALGSAASLFAGEREDGTFEQLRILAIPAGRVLVSKLCFAVLATAGMLAILWAIAFQFSRGQLPGDDVYRSLWTISGIACVEALAWGLFFSLITRRALTAALLAAAAVCLSFPLIRLVVMIYEVPVVEPPPFRVSQTMQILTPSFIVARLGLAACVLVLDVVIALNWVLERPQLIRRAALLPIGRPRLVSPLSRLVWQEARQAARTIAVLFVLAFVVLVVIGSVTAGPRGFDSGFALFVCILLSAVMGTCAFLAEQEGKQFRFFADHGIGSREVWWSKQVVWFTATLLASILIGIFAASSSTGIFWAEYLRPPFERVLMGLLMPLVGYCSGQLASILIPRGLVAGFVAILLTFLIGLWMGLMSGLGIELWWSAAPIPLIFLIATRARVSDWLLERATWRAWGRFAAVLGLPVAALLAGVAAYRVFEIPATGPGFDPQEVLRPAMLGEKETAELYRQAIAHLKSYQGVGIMRLDQPDAPLARQGWDRATETDRKWLNENQEALGLTARTSQHETCVFREPATTLPTDSLQTEIKTRELAWLLALDARRLEADGELDAALDRYLAMLRMARHVANRATTLQWQIGTLIESLALDRLQTWSAHPDQTPERIRKAVAELQKHGAQFPSGSDTMKVDYVGYRRLIEMGTEDFLAAVDHQSPGLLILCGRLMPWETVRSRRLLDALVDNDLKELSALEQDLATGRTQYLYHGSFDSGVPAPTSLSKALASSPFVLVVYPVNRMLPRLIVQRQMLLRATQTLFILKAWQVEHGELPRTLLELGESFNQLPKDPYTGHPFGYRPEGFDEPIRFSMPTGFESKPGQPLIWSAGASRAKVARDVRADGAGPGYGIQRQQPNEPARSPDGWAFPIP
jgi:ABC-type transport system involved in multi-copper enzyme maturation permease subunit